MAGSLALFHIMVSSSRKPGGNFYSFLWMLGYEREDEPVRTVGSEVPDCHLSHTLLVRASHKTGLHSRSREIDSVS